MFLSWLGLVMLGDPGVLDPGVDGAVGAPGVGVPPPGEPEGPEPPPEVPPGPLPPGAWATAGDARNTLVSAIAMPAFHVMALS